MLGVAGGVKELEGDVGKHTGQDSRVACVVDWFGPSELLTMNDYPSRIDHDSPTSPESLLIGGAIQKNKEAARNASPLTHVSKSSAPHLIMHGTEDPLVPVNQSERLAAALRREKVPVVFIKITGGGHGFGGEEIDRRVRDYLDGRLLGREVKVSEEAIAAKGR